MTKCKKCGREKVPYITDPDVVEDFCPECDVIPGGAEPSALPTFLAMITPKKKIGGKKMFKGKIKAGVLKECIDVIRGIDDKAVVNISAGGWSVKMVDPATVALVSFELQRYAFIRFEFSGDKIKVGVDFATLDLILNAAMTGGEGEGDEVEVEMEGDEELKHLFIKAGIFEYTLPLFDPSSFIREPKLPELGFSTQAIVETDKLIRAIRLAERMDDEYATLSVDSSGLFLKVGGEKGILKAALSADIQEKNGNIHSAYNLEYLLGVVKGIHHAEQVTVKFRTDYPLSIDFEVAGGYGKVKYLLAPRIPPEGEEEGEE